MKIINESVQLIHIDSKTHLTSTIIYTALVRASAGRTYAKFYTDKHYIQVNFMRDNTIAVSSNIRNPAFINSLWQRDRQGWTLSSAKDFVYLWMQQSRRTLS